MKNQTIKLSNFVFRDIKKGMSAHLTIELTEKDILDFAKLTGDYSPLHVDAEFGNQSVFGKNIAHGLLVSSWVSTLAGMLLPGKDSLILYTKFEFLHPAFAGDKLLITGKVTELIEATKSFKMEISIFRSTDLLIKGQLGVKVGDNGTY